MFVSPRMGAFKASLLGCSRMIFQFDPHCNSRAVLMSKNYMDLLSNLDLDGLGVSNFGAS